MSDTATPEIHIMSIVLAAAPTSCTFRARERAGRWYVTRDDQFYGDYNTRAQAMAAACFGARTADAKGLAARVLAGTHGNLVPHLATAAA